MKPPLLYYSDLVYIRAHHFVVSMYIFHIVYRNYFSMQDVLQTFSGPCFITDQDRKVLYYIVIEPTDCLVSIFSVLCKYQVANMEFQECAGFFVALCFPKGNVVLANS